jgi:hypothetical protein
MAKLYWRYIRHTKYIPGHWNCTPARYSIWRYYQSLFVLRAADGTPLSGKPEDHKHRTLAYAKRSAQILENNNFPENNS